MDPLSLTASAIGLATFAAQCCKQTYSIISGLTDAPRTIAQSKELLLQTTDTLVALERLLKDNKNSAVLQSSLRAISLDQALKSTQGICSDIGTSVASITKRSTNTRFSSRDRVAVYLNESRIIWFNQQLGNCRQTLLLAMGTITLILLSRTTENVKENVNRLWAHEKALVDLSTNLQNQSSRQSVQKRQTERERQLDPSRILQKTCAEALVATKAKRTGQSFGAMLTGGGSTAMQGIVGDQKKGVQQTFGKLTAMNESRAFQGQMTNDAFKTMFGARS